MLFPGFLNETLLAIATQGRAGREARSAPSQEFLESEPDVDQDLNVLPTQAEVENPATEEGIEETLSFFRGGFFSGSAETDDVDGFVLFGNDSSGDGSDDDLFGFGGGETDESGFFDFGGDEGSGGGGGDSGGGDEFFNFDDTGGEFF
jgi:hypothetical protein